MAKTSSYSHALHTLQLLYEAHLLFGETLSPSSLPAAGTRATPACCSLEYTQTLRLPSLSLSVSYRCPLRCSLIFLLLFLPPFHPLYVRIYSIRQVRALAGSAEEEERSMARITSSPHSLLKMCESSKRSRRRRYPLFLSSFYYILPSLFI